MRLSKYITELSVAKKPKIKYIVKPDLFHADIKLDIDYYMAPAPSEYSYYFDAQLDTFNSVQRLEFEILNVAYNDYMTELENRPPDHRFNIDAPAIWNITFEDTAARMDQVPKGKQVALNLFAALEMVFKEFINRKDPLVFQFDADIAEPSRVKLYNTLAKRIQKNGFDLDIGHANKTKLYLFMKKGLDRDWWKDQHYIGK